MSVFCVPRVIITARNSAAVSYSVDTCAGVDLGGGGGGAHRGHVPPSPPHSMTWHVTRS